MQKMEKTAKRRTFWLGYQGAEEVVPALSQGIRSGNFQSYPLDGSNMLSCLILLLKVA